MLWAPKGSQGIRVTNLAIGEEEEVRIQVEGNLVNLELELLLMHDLVLLDVDERDKVLLVTDGDGATVL